MLKTLPSSDEEGWRAERRGGYLLKPKESSRNQRHPLPPLQLRRGAFSLQASLRAAILRAASPTRPNCFYPVTTYGMTQVGHSPHSDDVQTAA